jgi:electron transport complex protein RnfG
MNEEKRELFNEEASEEISEKINEEINEEVNEEIAGASGSEANDGDRGSQIDEVIAGEPEVLSGEATEEKRGTAGKSFSEILSGLFTEEVREMMSPALRLFAICLATAFCLAFIYDITKDTIAMRNQQAAEEQRMQVQSAADSFEKIEGWEDQDETGLVKEVHAAYSGDKFIGYVFSTVSSGYGGDIAVTVGVGSDSTITGITVGENQETPGLGGKVANEKFTSQYAGKDISREIKIVTGKDPAENGIQAVSGATISTNAVNRAVQASADLGAKLLQQNGGGNK